MGHGSPTQDPAQPLTSQSWLCSHLDTGPCPSPPGVPARPGEWSWELALFHHPAFLPGSGVGACRPLILLGGWSRGKPQCPLGASGSQSRAGPDPAPHWEHQLEWGRPPRPAPLRAPRVGGVARQSPHPAPAPQQGVPVGPWAVSLSLLPLGQLEGGRGGPNIAPGPPPCPGLAAPLMAQRRVLRDFLPAALLHSITGRWVRFHPAQTTRQLRDFYTRASSTGPRDSPGWTA